MASVIAMPTPYSGVRFEAVGTGISVSSGSSGSCSHSASSGPDTAVLLFVNVNAANAIASYTRTATYGGTAMTSLGTFDYFTLSNHGWMEVYYLYDPPAGSQTVSWSAGTTVTSMVGNTVSYTGVRVFGTPVLSTANTNNTAMTVSAVPILIGNDISRVASFLGAIGAVGFSGIPAQSEWSISSPQTTTIDDAVAVATTTNSATLGASDYWGAISVPLYPFAFDEITATTNITFPSWFNFGVSWMDFVGLGGGGGGAGAGAGHTLGTNGGATTLNPNLGSINYGATGTAGTSNSGAVSSVTTTHTPASTDNGVIVWVAITSYSNTASAPTSVTFGGTAMTLLTSQVLTSAQVGTLYAYELIQQSPFGAQSNSIVATFSGTTKPVIAVVNAQSFSNVVSFVPTGTNTVSTAWSSGAIPSATNDIVAQAFFGCNASSNFTVGSYSGTQDYNSGQITSGSDRTVFVMGHTAGASSVTFTATCTSNTDFASIGIDVSQLITCAAGLGSATPNTQNNPASNYTFNGITYSPGTFGQGGSSGGGISPASGLPGGWNSVSIQPVSGDTNAVTIGAGGSAGSGIQANGTPGNAGVAFVILRER